MGKAQRDKGRRYELEVRDALASFSPAQRTSEAGLPVPDLFWMNRYVECRIRAKKHQSLATAHQELKGDASLYVTRVDREESLVVMTLDGFLDLLDEARKMERGPMKYG
jgi:hypothetical protein